ncbi:TRDC protein, partial [Heliornis fulica]|nr:TRDC protein [Heliornis fulica]
MKSEKLGEGGSTRRAACLARNVSTKNIELKMSSKDVVYEQSTPILTSDALYNSIKVVSVTKDTEVTCNATVNNVIYTPETMWTEKEAEKPVMVKVCNATDTSTQANTEVEKGNMLSMTVVGLRLLLAKSIAFNTLMSVKLFLF